MKEAPVVWAMILARVVLPTPGGPQKIMEVGSSLLDGEAEGFAGAEEVILAGVLGEGAGAHALGEGGAAVGGCWAVEGRDVEEAHARGSAGVPTRRAGGAS